LLRKAIMYLRDTSKKNEKTNMQKAKKGIVAHYTKGIEKKEGMFG